MRFCVCREFCFNNTFSALKTKTARGGDCKVQFSDMFLVTLYFCVFVVRFWVGREFFFNNTFSADLFFYYFLFFRVRHGHLERLSVFSPGVPRRKSCSGLLVLVCWPWSVGSGLLVLVCWFWVCCFWFVGSGLLFVGSGLLVLVCWFRSVGSGLFGLVWWIFF